MKPSENILATLLVSALMITLSACDDRGPLENVGEEIDDAVDDAGDAIDDAFDN